MFSPPQYNIPCLGQLFSSLEFYLGQVLFPFLGL